MPSKLDLLIDIVKGVAALGIFTAFIRLVKKGFAKRKAANELKRKDRAVMIEMLDKVGMLEPRLKAIDAKLKKMSENQKAILNMQNISYFVFDAHGFCEYASPAVCQLIRHPESRILQSGWLALLIEADKERIKKAWKFAIETISVFDEIFTYRESNIKVHCIAFYKVTDAGSYDGSFAQLKAVE